MLLEYLEEEFYLPSVPVDFADGSSSKTKVIGQKLNPPLVFIIPDHYPAQESWILEAGSGAGESDKLVDEDIGPLWHGTVLDNFIRGVAFKPGNEEYAGIVPLSKEVKVVVTPVHGDDAARRKREMTSNVNIGSLAISDNGEVGHITVVVQ